MSICFEDIYFKKWNMSVVAHVRFSKSTKNTLWVFLNSLCQSYINDFLYIFSCTETEGAGVPPPSWDYENIM